MAAKRSTKANLLIIGKFAIWGSAFLWAYNLGFFLFSFQTLAGLALYVIFELAALKQEAGKLLWAVRTVAILLPVCISIFIISLHNAFATFDSYTSGENPHTYIIFTVSLYLTPALLLLLGVLLAVNDSVFTSHKRGRGAKPKKIPM